MKRKHRLRQRRNPTPPAAPPLWRVLLGVYLFGSEMEWALVQGLIELRLARMLTMWAVTQAEARVSY